MARGAAFWGLLASAFVVPVAGMVLTLHTVPDRVDALNPTPVPVVVTVHQVTVDGEHAATGALAWTGGPAVVAPAWSGLVTAVAVAPGDEVTTGTVLAGIGGIDRIAVASPRPFHRRLAEGDHGPDVAMLRVALRDLGHPTRPASDPARFDRALARAVGQLEVRLAHVPAGQATGVFHPEWFGWLPVDRLTVGQLSLGVGKPAPPAGETVLAGRPTLASVHVTVGEGARLIAGRPYVFGVGEVAVPLTEGLTADGQAVAALAAAVAPGAEKVDGRVRLAESRSAVVVPISAVQTRPDGGQCVLRVVDGSYRPTQVVVAGGGVGTAEIGSGVAAGEQVLSNPVEAGVTCV